MKFIEKHLQGLAKQTLPYPLEGHELRFQRKLQQHNRPALKMYTWMSMAASIILILSLNVISFSEKPETNQQLTMFYEQQIAQHLEVLEASYSIDFDIAVRDLKSQLTILNGDYKTLVIAFEENHKHPLILKAMIENLRQQLTLLLELENNLNGIKTLRNENEIL
ncbi:MAG: hypothetical protein ACPH19_06075 [Flavobacteriaceae bacterium]